MCVNADFDQDYEPDLDYEKIDSVTHAHWQSQMLRVVKILYRMKNPAPGGGVSQGRHFDFCVASHGESTQGSNATGAVRASKQANFSQVAEGKLRGSDRSLRASFHAALPLEGALPAPEIEVR